ncbi:IKI3 family-domain-containing protein [Xylaria bambusicola]|uniref:IKI3 family-domain-containing protein n=1 Tax=Xylaria bambusicola TaxID=326684 RepID=UPI00200745AD|nr:IKI3 family-domain-containing protein [Xylaria bambusicola]KAI0513210.1 IKI3 family-domain-containing protein [Xylaria bambusicola]
MRNLRNIRYNAWNTSTSFDGSAITSSCWDPAKDEILCTLGPDARDGRIRLLRILEHVRASSIDVECQEVASWDAPSPNPDLAVDRVVSLHHFADSLTTCLVLEGGDIVVVVESEGQASSDSVYIEIKGSIDEGITAASWSPDEELLAITTKAKTVVFMSRTFDGITDATMTAEDLKASKHVSVGWGKKETQFQGRGAKALKDPTIPEKVDQGIISPADDGKTSISWRGDGAYVAISAIEDGIRRVIRVYSRDGVLDSASEPVDHMDSALSWRPAGNLMASIQRLEDRVDVIFFERNGLRHGQFTLRPPENRTLTADKIDLSWNCDSTVLAVTLSDRIQLWTMGNYHWYLKQEVFTTNQPTEIVWHPEKPLRFGAAIAGKLIQAEYIFEVARGSLSPPYDYGAVAVIDGQNLKVTPFRTANVPPPMAMFELPISSSAIDVAFSPANNFMAVLHQTGVDLYEWITQQQRSLCPRLIGTTEFAKEHLGDHLLPLQISVTETFSIHCLCSGGEGPLIFSRGFDPFSGEFLPGTTMYSGSIFGFSRLTQAISEDVVAQDALGKLHGVANQVDELFSVRHNSQLPWSEVIDLAGNVVAIGLSRNGHLYANTRLLLKNCTSFLVTPAHLIITTTNHLLKFIHLTDVDLMEVPPDDPETDERCRSIERGGRLVTAMPTNMSLILQMPRGNLETIFPRAMVVAGIRKLIEALDYAKAFAFCRTQRVDMNILYDHKPAQFLSHIGLFLEQIQDVANIDLFLSSLRDEDVTQTMYRDTKASKDESRTTELSAEPNLASGDVSKVNIICDTVLSHLQSRNTMDHGTLQNIITANICKSPPAFEDGLQVVATLMKEDDKLAETAVEHICFLADVNTLYDEALGLYHLDLALLVAQQSQRDPREYLPFIQNLHQLPELRMKVAIDDHLSRHEKSLSHLKDMNAHKEAQDYTVKHSLYSTALKLYRYDATNLPLLRGLYATYLESKSKYRDAGLIYESLQDYTAATRCYRAAGVSCWRECLFVAHQQTPALTPDALNELATTLAEAVYEAKDYAAAATIHLEHLGSLEAAIPCLCKGYLFADAMRLCIQRQKTSLLSLVDTSIADSLGSTTEFLADCKSQLLAQVPRIAELRRKAAEDPLGFYEGERAGGADVPDDVSVAASSRVTHGGASLFTRYTGKNSVGTLGTGVSRATSKNRRREEKKRARGRKGTVYEEEYLVNSVRRLVERLETTRPDIDRLVAALVRRSMIDRARAVESLAAEVIEACQKAIKEVFPGGKEEEKEVEQGAEEEWRPMGGDAVFADALDAAWRKQEPPAIAAFERMSLLG